MKEKHHIRRAKRIRRRQERKLAKRYGTPIWIGLRHTGLIGNPGQVIYSLDIASGESHSTPIILAWRREGIKMQSYRMWQRRTT